MQDIGAKSVSEMLKRNQTLSELYLNDNKITDSAIRILCSALAGNGSLTSLGLDKNQVCKVQV